MKHYSASQAADCGILVFRAVGHWLDNRQDVAAHEACEIAWGSARAADRVVEGNYLGAMHRIALTWARQLAEKGRSRW